MEIQKEYDGKWYFFKNDSDTEGTEFSIPTVKAICWDCGGEGHTLVEGLRGDVTEMVNEDPDFAEGYFGGRYDETCRTCHGKNVVDAPNYDALAPELKKAVIDYLEEEDANRREAAHERAMGY